MFKKTCISIIFLCFFSLANAHEPKFSDRTDILHILESYSERTGTKFVTDPRVKARVNMIGLDIDAVTQKNLNEILNLHVFVAYERDGVVYVLPISVAKAAGFEASEIWGG